MKEVLLGYSIDVLDVDSCCDQIISNLTSGSKTWLACFNPHSYAVSKTDHKFSKALCSATWLVPDGVGVVVSSKFCGGKIYNRLTGSDIFLGLNERINAIGEVRVFFLGSSENTLNLIRKRLHEDYPNIILAGTYSPPYSPEYSFNEINNMVDAINSVRPDVLWVGMTAPKQEKWIFDNLPKLNVKFAAAIGAVFDFYAGTVTRPSPVFQKMGLEWLLRFLKQPRRLWRRTLVSAPIFFIDSLCERFGKK